MTVAPVIGADVLADGCCMEMFNGCRLLAHTPDLVATRMAASCYEAMFAGCRIEYPPALPSTHLDERCYRCMFYGCTKLRAVPDLPAQKLEESCYDGMFAGCPSIGHGPIYDSNWSAWEVQGTTAEINATKMAKNCCRRMFYGCSTRVPNANIGLEYVPVRINAENMAEGCFREMFAECKALHSSRMDGFDGVKKLAKRCCMDMFRGCVAIVSDTLRDFPGNITSEEDYGLVLEESCYEGMFSECSSMLFPGAFFYVSIHDSKNTARSCFKNMFKGCTSLTLEPYDMVVDSSIQDVYFAFPGEDVRLSESCYEGMFEGCESLSMTMAKLVLPATEMMNSCYKRMFKGCTSIDRGPVIDVEDLRPSLPAEYLAESCYESMFEGCSSMKMAQKVLPGQVLRMRCYKNMFKDCPNLGDDTDYVSSLAEYFTPDIKAKFSSDGAMQGMFYISTGAYTKLRKVTVGFEKDPEEKYQDPYSSWIGHANPGLVSPPKLYVPSGAAAVLSKMATPFGWEIVEEA